MRISKRQGILLFVLLLRVTCFSQPILPQEKNLGNSYLNYSKLARYICSDSIGLLGNQSLLMLGELERILENCDSVPINESLLEYLSSKKMNHLSITELFVRIADKPIVILNEAHDRIKPRVFILNQLHLFKKLGFTHIAFETVSNENRNLNGNTGLYTCEPVFGELYRKAVEYGFNILSYESFDIKRDSMQAENLYSKIRKSDGTVYKTLVICGYGHLYEWYPTANQKMMGAYLKDISGVDPFTIDQVTYQEAECNEFKKTLFKALADTIESVCYSSEEFDKTEMLPPLCDMYIVHPQTKWNNNRSTDYELNGRRICYHYNLKKKKSILVQVYLKKEFTKTTIDNCVPTDQITVCNVSDPILFLEKGKKYLIVERAINNSILSRHKVKIR